MARTLRVGCVVACLVTPGCGDDALPLDEYEEVAVHAYFYFPNDTERYLGKYHGAAACGDAAYAYAREKGMSSYTSWSYICCTIRNGSECYEKIR